MHCIDERDGVFHRGLLQDAVAKVEDVSGAVAGLIEDFFRAMTDLGAVGQEHAGLEVALQGTLLADGFSSFVQPTHQSPPISSAPR